MDPFFPGPCMPLALELSFFLPFPTFRCPWQEAVGRRQDNNKKSVPDRLLGII